MVQPPTGKWGFIYRPNNVPYYQRLFQKDDGIRQWNKTSKSKYILPPYYFMLYGSLACSLYMMGRMVLGHKTWFGKG